MTLRRYGTDNPAAGFPAAVPFRLQAFKAFHQVIDPGFIPAHQFDSDLLAGFA